MRDLDADGPTAAELAEIEAELPECDRLRVRDYWDAVIASEVGARQSPASPYAWPERVPTRRPVLRLITGAATEHAPGRDAGEAA